MRVTLIVVLAAPIFCFLAAFVLWVYTKIPARDVAPGVNVARIEQVRLGMRPEEVIGVLGWPLDYYADGHGPSYLFADSERQGKTVRVPAHARIGCLRYAREVSFRASSTLNIFFDSTRQVSGVYASAADGYDEKKQVYNLHREGGKTVINRAELHSLFD